MRQPAVAVDALGQSEIGHHRDNIVRQAALPVLAVRGTGKAACPTIEQDVGRFQIAVEDAALMRIVDGSRHRRDQVRGPLLLTPAP